MGRGLHKLGCGERRARKPSQSACESSSQCASWHVKQTGVIPCCRSVRCGNCGRVWSDCGCWRERRRGAAGDSRLSISRSFPNWWVWCERDSNKLLTCILSGLERAYLCTVCVFTTHAQEVLERAVLAYCREAEREEEEGTQTIVRQPFRYVFMSW